MYTLYSYQKVQYMYMYILYVWLYNYILSMFMTLLASVAVMKLCMYANSSFQNDFGLFPFAIYISKLSS